MSRLYTSGAESGHFQAEGVTKTGVAAGLTIATDQVRSGARAFKCDTGVAAGNYVARTFTGVSGRKYWSRMYYRLASGALGAYSPIVMEWYCSNTGIWLESHISNSTGRLVVAASAGLGTQDTGYTFPRDQWVCVEMAVMVDVSGNDAAEIWVDGVQLGNYSGFNWASNVLSGVTWGNDSGQTSTVASWWDDAAINDDQGADQNGRPGPGKVYYLVPTSDVGGGTAPGNWQKPGGATTNLYTSVDNEPPVYAADSTSAAAAESFVRNATSASSDFTVGMETYSAAGVLDTDIVRVLQVLAEVGSSSTVSKALTLGMPANPVLAQAAPAEGAANFGTVAASGTATTWNRKAGAVQYNPAVAYHSAPQVRVNRGTGTGTAMINYVALIVEVAPGDPLVRNIGNASEPTNVAVTTMKVGFGGAKAGEQVAVACHWGSGSQTGALTDSQGHAWTPGTPVQNGSGGTTQLYWTKLTVDLVDDVDTFTHTRSGTSRVAMQAIACDASLPQTADVNASGQSAVAGTAVATAATAATAGADLVVAAIGTQAATVPSVSAGSGYTLGSPDHVQTNNGFGVSIEWRVQGAAGAETATATLSGAALWSAYVQTFKAAGGPQLFVVTASDSAPATDAVARSLSVARSGSESAPAGDAVTRSMVLVRSAADAAAATDAAVRAIQAFVRAAADSAPASDVAAKSAQSFQRTTSDSAPTSDSATGGRLFTRSAADSAPASDAATRGAQVYLRTGADTAGASDAATRGAQTFSRTAADSAPAADSATGGRLFTRSVSDTAGATDAATRGALVFTRSSSDTASATDAATRSTSQARTAADSAPAADAATRTFGQQRAASDSAPASDAAASLRRLLRVTADTASASDAATSRRSYSRSSADTAGATDSVSRAVFVQRTTSDALPVVTDEAAWSPFAEPPYTPPPLTVVGISPRTTVVGLSPKATVVGSTPRAVAVGTSPKATAVGVSPKSSVTGTSPKSSVTGQSPKSTAVEP